MLVSGGMFRSKLAMHCEKRFMVFITKVETSVSVSSCVLDFNGLGWCGASVDVWRRFPVKTRLIKVVCVDRCNWAFFAYSNSRKNASQYLGALSRSKEVESRWSCYIFWFTYSFGSDMACWPALLYLDRDTLNWRKQLGLVDRCPLIAVLGFRRVWPSYP